jgi:hypothetical protein
MPLHEPDPSDPNMLVGVLLPGDDGAMRTMAEVFADEFARLGLPPSRICGLFANPFYGGAHAAWQALGEPAVRAIVETAVERWPRVAIVDAADADGEV